MARLREKIPCMTPVITICAMAILAWPAESASLAGQPPHAGPALRQPAQAADGDLPNIVLFLVDDLGWQDTSVSFDRQPSLFQKHFRTPHVARLASRGVRFTNAYAHCVCSPTRTSIMTGLNPASHQVTNWTLRADRDSSGTTQRLTAPPDWRMSGIQPDTNTLPRRLQSGGYTTIHVGKAHWGAIGTEGSDPRTLGFDVNIAGHAAGAPGSYQGLDDYDKPGNADSRSVWAVPGLGKYHRTETHLTDALAIEAVLAIDRAVEQDKPFFLYMAPYAVHTPIQPHPRFIEHYRGRTYPETKIEIPETEARYASMVEGYDAALGRIMDRLRDRNIADRTIVIFTSDNGGLSVHTRDTTPRGTGANTHNHPLREGKGSAYEGGTRVPLIIAWAAPDSGSPRQQETPWPAGTTCATPVISEDLMKTICGWAGVDPFPNAMSRPAHPNSTVDLNQIGEPDAPSGEPDAPSGEPDVPSGERSLLFHYPHVWGPQGAGYQPHSSVRRGPWKVIYFYDSQSWELYNLETDIGESKDLAASQPDRLTEMADLLVQQLAAHNAQFPVNRQTGRPETIQMPGQAIAPAGENRKRP